MKTLIVMASALTLMACGGDDGPSSGIDPDRTIESLDMEEARAICEDAISAQGGPGTTFSCDEIEITVGTVSECTADIDSATCTNTVGELNDCIAAMEEDSCSIFLPVCSILITCSM